MKKNLPVTGQDHPVPEGVRLVSRTDTKGVITYANDHFVAVSGFTRDELLGSAHNIVRHPDMPPQAFEHMWQTLKQGAPWRGVVKNRCKNGDHYWVDAHVVPVRKNGATIGYMSVRTRAAPEAIARAEALYAQVAGGAPLPRADGGLWRRYLSVKNGVTLGIVFVTLMMIAGGILGITGLKQSSRAMRGLYYEQMVPVQAIGRINFLMADNRAQVALALRDIGPDERAVAPIPTASYLGRLAHNRAEIDALWAQYEQLARGAAEREYAHRYWQARQRYVEQALQPAQAALAEHDYLKLDVLMRERVTPLYEEANGRATELLAFLSDQARADFIAVAAHNDLIAGVAVAGIGLGCLALLFAGLYFFRGTVLPLQAAVTALERIAEGNLSDENPSSGFGEPARVMTSVTVMQLHLKVMMDEIAYSSGSIRGQCQRLNQTMMNLAQHSEEQHDRVYQTVDAASLACDGLNRLADDAQAMLLLAEGGAAVDSGVDQQEALAEAAAPAAPTLPEAQDGLEWAALLPEDSPGARPDALAPMAQDLAAAARIEAFAMGDTVAQMNQVAMLIVENRAEVQDAWAASQRLEQTAGELDRLVNYFD